MQTSVPLVFASESEGDISRLEKKEERCATKFSKMVENEDGWSEENDEDEEKRARHANATASDDIVGRRVDTGSYCTRLCLSDHLAV